MSIMEDRFYICEHCGKLVDRFENASLEFASIPHDCYMKHIHKVLEAKNNRNNRNNRKKSNGA